MFPRLKERLGAAVLDRVDLLVELSTLGEYGLAEDGLPVPIVASSRPVRPAAGIPRVARTRDECSQRGASSATCHGPGARP